MLSANTIVLASLLKLDMMYFLNLSSGSERFYCVINIQSHVNIYKYKCILNKLQMNKVLYLTGTNNSARIRLMRSSSDVSLSSSDFSSRILMGLLRLDRPVYKKRFL